MKRLVCTECDQRRTYNINIINIITAIPSSVLVDTRTGVVIDFVLRRKHLLKNKNP